MEFIDYYKVLGLDKNASEKDIKKAYRKLARQHHPDLHPDDQEAKKKFQLINEAHEVLKNPESRKKYDQYGEHWKHADEIERQRSAQEHSFGSEQFSGASHFGDGDFSKFFESIFGAQAGSFSGHTPKFRGQDVHATMQIQLSEVLSDQKRTFEIHNKKIRITVPAGIDDGQTIKLTGHGQPGVNGGPNGDLYINFLVTNDLPFERNGSNLHTSCTIPLTLAVLGGEKRIETLDGQVSLKIAAGTQNGTKVRLKGKGLPKYKVKDSFGDLIVEYQVLIPTALTDKERKLFEELQKEQHEKAA
ncbi:MAG: J domain-containing protein [Bdellovibrionales bacterium]|nr:J domain-containing protein [Bdellovibrionales bacterium]